MSYVADQINYIGNSDLHVNSTLKGQVIENAISVSSEVPSDVMSISKVNHAEVIPDSVLSSSNVFSKSLMPPIDKAIPHSAITSLIVSKLPIGLVDRRVDALLAAILPSPDSLSSCSRVSNFVSHVLKNSLGANVFPISAYSSNCNLDCDDISMSLITLLCLDDAKSWIARVSDVLLSAADKYDEASLDDQISEEEVDATANFGGSLLPVFSTSSTSNSASITRSAAGNRAVSDASDVHSVKSSYRENDATSYFGVQDSHGSYYSSSGTPLCNIRSVSFYSGRNKRIVADIDSLSCQLQTNNYEELCLTVLLEVADMNIGQDHLLKRSIILARAWAAWDADRFFPRSAFAEISENGYSPQTPCLSLSSISWSTWVTLMLWVFIRRKDFIKHPVQALFFLMTDFSNFPHDTHALSIHGAIPFSALHKVCVEESISLHFDNIPNLSNKKPNPPEGPVRFRFNPFSNLAPSKVGDFGYDYDAVIPPSAIFAVIPEAELISARRRCARRGAGGVSTLSGSGGSTPSANQSSVVQPPMSGSLSNSMEGLKIQSSQLSQSMGTPNSQSSNDIIPPPALRSSLAASMSSTSRSLTVRSICTLDTVVLFVNTSESMSSRDCAKVKQVFSSAVKAISVILCRLPEPSEVEVARNTAESSLVSEITSIDTTSVNAVDDFFSRCWSHYVTDSLLGARSFGGKNAWQLVPALAGSVTADVRAELLQAEVDAKEAYISHVYSASFTGNVGSLSLNSVDRQRGFSVSSTNSGWVPSSASLNLPIGATASSDFSSSVNPTKALGGSGLFDVLAIDLDSARSAIDYCSYILDAEVTAPALLALSSEILFERGSLPVGEIGKLLQDATANVNLSAILKEKFGGLKRFIETHMDVFVLGTDHPFNPHVFLKAVGNAPAPVGTSSGTNTLSVGITRGSVANETNTMDEDEKKTRRTRNRKNKEANNSSNGPVCNSSLSNNTGFSSVLNSNSPLSIGSSSMNLSSSSNSPLVSSLGVSQGVMSSVPNSNIMQQTKMNQQMQSNHPLNLTSNTLNLNNGFPADISRGFDSSYVPNNLHQIQKNEVLGFSNNFPFEMENNSGQSSYTPNTMNHTNSSGFLQQNSTFHQLSYGSDSMSQNNNSIGNNNNSGISNSGSFSNYGYGSNWDMGSVPNNNNSFNVNSNNQSGFNQFDSGMSNVGASRQNSGYFNGGGSAVNNASFQMNSGSMHSYNQNLGNSSPQVINSSVNHLNMTHLNQSSQGTSISNSNLNNLNMVNGLSSNNSSFNNNSTNNNSLVNFQYMNQMSQTPVSQNQQFSNALKHASNSQNQQNGAVQPYFDSFSQNSGYNRNRTVVSAGPHGPGFLNSGSDYNSGNATINQFAYRDAYVSGAFNNNSNSNNSNAKSNGNVVSNSNVVVNSNVLNNNGGMRSLTSYSNNNNITGNTNSGVPNFSWYE